MKIHLCDFCLIMLIFVGFVVFSVLHINLINAEIADSQDEETQLDELLKEGNSLAVLFTKECCSCTECVEAEVLLGGMSKELEENLDLLVVRLKSEKMKSRFGIKRVPTLIYIRDNKTAVYIGKFEFERLFMWLQNNREPATIDLNDSTFEHLTQAATGATTGDWLVIFHDNECCKNRELMHLETAGTRMRNKVNVASVDILKSPETKERFKISNCPEIIFFRHQKMYRFSLPDVNSKTLRRFAEGFYKNSKVESVPLPASLFDRILDKTIQFGKENSYAVIIVLIFTILSTVILLFCTIVGSSSHKKSD